MSTLEEDSTVSPSFPSNTIFVFRDALLLSLDSFHSCFISFLGTYQANFCFKGFAFSVPSALGARLPRYLHGWFPHFFQNFTQVTIIVGAFLTTISKMSNPSCEGFPALSFLFTTHHYLIYYRFFFSILLFSPLIKCNL